MKNKKKFKKILMAFTTFFCISLISATAASADEIIDQNSVHGDPSMVESGISAYSAADLARYYPSGSYFSVNKKECECHGTYYCSNTNYTCNCSRYNYYKNGYNNSNGMATAWQCNGFARLAYNEYNDQDVPWVISNNNFSTLTTSNLYSKLSSIGSQAFVTGKTSGEDPHSVFIVGFTSNSVTIWEANYGGRCLISNVQLTYSQFLQRIKTIDWAYTSGGTLIDY